MYKYYKKTEVSDNIQNQWRTIGRREVTQDDFDSRVLKCLFYIFVVSFLFSIPAAIIGIPYSWIVTAVLAGLETVFAITNLLISSLKYNNYVKELEQDPNQRELEAVFNLETQKIRTEIRRLNDTKLAELTMEDVELLDRLRNELLR